MLKIGIDVHGVLDTFPEVVKLIETLQQVDAVEIHIITGLSREHADTHIGHLVDLSTVKYFSIADHLISKGIAHKVENGLPFFEEEAWNKAKAIYCKREDIDFMLDDSPSYGEYFMSPSIRTIFCHVQNPNRRIYKVR